MTQPLTLRYRPRTFSDIVGQKSVRLVLTQMIRTQEIRPAMLFWGSHGSGKTSAARILASALNCSEEDPAARPCGECGICTATAEGRWPDVVEIDAASNGRAEDMRKLQEDVRRAAMSRYRVIVIDECHAMSSQGFQTLLKTLEQPPPNTVFVLVTTDRDKVPETINSRSLSLEFRRLTDEQVAGRLRHIADLESIELSPELALDIAKRSKGIARDAVGLLDQCRLILIKTPEQLALMLGDNDHGVAMLRPLASGPDYDGAYAACHAALSVLPSPAEVVAALVTTLRRTLVLSLDAGGSSLSPPPSDAERALAGQVSGQGCIAALKMVWEYYARIAPAADAFAACDLLITMVGQALTSPSSPSLMSTSMARTGPLSFEDLASAT